MSEAIRKLVERHSANLESAARALKGDNIGGADRTGHQAVLHRMAADLRATAARGVLPSSFSDNSMMHASAAASLPGPVIHAMRSFGLEMGPGDTIALADLDATFSANRTDPGDRIAIKSALAASGRLTS